MPRSRDEIFSLGDEVGAAEMRRLKATNKFHSMELGSVDKWLSLADSASKDRAEAREEESLSVSRKALRSSERATNIAIGAIVLSIGMAALEIIKWYSK